MTTTNPASTGYTFTPIAKHPAMQPTAELWQRIGDLNEQLAAVQHKLLVMRNAAISVTATSCVCHLCKVLNAALEESK